MILFILILGIQDWLLVLVLVNLTLGFIRRLRRDIALHHNYIMSAVDYDSMVLDLVDLGEIDNKILLKIEFKGDTNDEV